MEQAGDAELIAAVRAGNDHAFGQLYQRHHARALRFARSLAGRSGDAEDLVSDAFARVLAVLKSGNGPNEAFRPYLLSALRNIYYNRARKAARELPVDEPNQLVDGPPIDPLLARDENRLVATAFRQLPERWQVVLWHTAVDGESLAKVGAVLGISANAVAALAYRAREGLRERYLQGHLSSTTDDRCRATVDKLAAHVRGKLSPAEAKRVRQHLDRCERCRVLFVDLSDVNSRLGAVIGPVVLGAAGAGYLASHVSAAGLAAVGHLLRRLDTQVGAAAVVTATVVTLAASPSPAPVAIAPRVNPAPPPVAPVAPEPSVTGTPAPAASPPTAAPPPKAPGLAAYIDVVKLRRGLPGQILLTVTNQTSGTNGTGVDLTARLSLPAGVTLRVANAGNGWTCAPVGEVIRCRRPDLRPGQSSRAVVQVWVSPDAASGLLSALVCAPGLRPVTVTLDGLPDPGPPAPQPRSPRSVAGTPRPIRAGQ